MKQYLLSPLAAWGNGVGRRLWAIVLLGLLCLPVSARYLTGQVKDKQGKDLPGATVELLNPADSSVIRATVTKERTAFGNKYTSYEIDVDNHTTYLLRFSMVGFKTQYKRVEVKMADRANEQWVADVRLEEDAKLLDEVVVKATKIKMVMRGDTIVYDASAFNLSEGSMLDALIRQLPGATLENGVIKVNGRTVSSLLVDGRDFFKGDAKKALENLPAYTVDKVKAYDKAGRESRYMKRDMGDKEFVLDVSLKKQYKHGDITNLDVAGGTRDRYSGRLFTMAYGKKSSLTLTANLNNVNNDRVPGQDDATGDQPTGTGQRTARKQLNANYRYEGKDEDNYFESNSGYAWVDDDAETRTNAQTFLTGGDYYNLSDSRSRTKNYTWQTNNAFGWTPKGGVVWGNVLASYTHNDGRGSSRSARFSEKPAGMVSLDSAFMAGGDRRLMRSVINRVRNDNQYGGHSATYYVSYNEYFKLGNRSNLWEGERLRVFGNAYYGNTTNDRFSLNRIDYLQQGTRDDRDQYSATRNHSYNYSLGASLYHFFINDSAGVRNLFLNPSYNYWQHYDSNDYGLYRLDRLADYDSTSYAIGVLPSTREALLGVQDAGNSYRMRQHQAGHNVELSLNYNSGDGTQRPYVNAWAKLKGEYEMETLEYYRAQAYHAKRNQWLFTPSAYAAYQFNDSTGTRQYSFYYTTSATRPDLQRTLTIRDDANPLVVSLGNPDLKNARTHNITLSAMRMRVKTQEVLYGYATYTIQQNALATATLYDKATGVTTTQLQNVNGNWSLSGGAHYQKPVDRKQHLTLALPFSFSYTNSVDLTTVASPDAPQGGGEAVRSNVHSWYLGFNPGLTWQIGDKLRLEFTPRLAYQRATGDRADFTTVSTWTYNFCLDGNVQLPAGMEFSSDITSYNRRGLNDPAMNTSNLVWNARLTKHLLKKKLALSLDAFDILHDINATTVTINSQGRTESWANSLPRYLMLHASYKFTLGMKKG